jgi:hypothetical protein
MVESNNEASFQWSFSNAQYFSGIFLKMKSFSGMDLIFSSQYHPKTPRQLGMGQHEQHLVAV